MKLAIQLLSLFGIVSVLESSGAVVSVVQWSDIGIVEQVRITAGIGLMILIPIVAFILFRSVWVRKGYEGYDGVLVDKEVSLFMSHVLAFILVEVFVFLAVFYNYMKPPQYVFWICGAGFLSPEAVQILHFIMDRFKAVKKGE